MTLRTERETPRSWIRGRRSSNGRTTQRVESFRFVRRTNGGAYFDLKLVCGHAVYGYRTNRGNGEAPFGITCRECDGLPAKRSHGVRASRSSELEAERMNQSDQRAAMPPIELAPNKRQQAAEASKRRLIEATAEILRTMGTHFVTMRSVGIAAGFSRGLVNYHFDSKTELMLLACEHLTGTRPTETHDGAIDRHVWEWLAAQKGKAS